MAVVPPELQIVWRNPERIQCRRRWEPLQETSNSTLYRVQEFLSTGEHGFWSTTYQLRFFRGNGVHRKKLGLCIGCGSEVRNEGKH